MLQKSWFPHFFLLRRPDPPVYITTFWHFLLYFMFCFFPRHISQGSVPCPPPHLLPDAMANPPFQRPFRSDGPRPRAPPLSAAGPAVPAGRRLPGAAAPSPGHPPHPAPGHGHAEPLPPRGDGGGGPALGPTRRGYEHTRGSPALGSPTPKPTTVAGVLAAAAAVVGFRLRVGAPTLVIRECARILLCFLGLILWPCQLPLVCHLRLG